MSREKIKAGRERRGRRRKGKEKEIFDNKKLINIYACILYRDYIIIFINKSSVKVY
jgi:hypothetical protein